MKFPMDMMVLIAVLITIIVLGLSVARFFH
jgi:hypothetical protein